jgi:hypothetical protein
MSHETWKPSNQTSFKAIVNFQTPHFAEVYHLGEITKQWYWITPFLFE